MFGGSNHHQHTPFSCEHLTNFMVQKKSLALNNKKVLSTLHIVTTWHITNTSMLTVIDYVAMYFIVIKFQRVTASYRNSLDKQRLSAKKKEEKRLFPIQFHYFSSSGTLLQPVFIWFNYKYYIITYSLTGRVHNFSGQSWQYLLSNEQNYKLRIDILCNIIWRRCDV